MPPSPPTVQLARSPVSKPQFVTMLPETASQTLAAADAGVAIAANPPTTTVAAPRAAQTRLPNTRLLILVMMCPPLDERQPLTHVAQDRPIFGRSSKPGDA